VAIDEHHVALPKLYGAPAYARPTRVAAETPRPFDPDDLPIEAVRTTEEQELIEELPAHAYANGNGSKGRGRHRSDDEPSLHPRPLSLKALAGRILGHDN
jgi:hypothetical protein